jgi:hypothetical protein
MNEARELSLRVPELPDAHRCGRYFPGSDRVRLAERLGLSAAETVQLLADAHSLSEWRREELSRAQNRA